MKNIYQKLIIWYILKKIIKSDNNDLSFIASTYSAYLFNLIASSDIMKALMELNFRNLYKNLLQKYSRL